MRAALIAPDRFTRSYFSGSSNITSNVTSKGPAFLLRITFANSRSVAITHPLRTRNRGVWPSVPRIFERHQVIDGETIRGAERHAERREGIRHVARGVADSRVARVLERAADEH